MRHSSNNGADKERILTLVAVLARQLSPLRLEGLAFEIRATPEGRMPRAQAYLSSKAMTDGFGELLDASSKAGIGFETLALALESASFALQDENARSTSELVWTGPSTPLSAIRRTEQVLVELIDSAQSELFLTSFVAYDVSSIITAINRASERGVSVSILLEASSQDGGSLNVDSASKLKPLLPSVAFYVWRSRVGIHDDGKVHAKVAVADGKACFVTSANLTRFAMEKNIEAGVVIRGGDVPSELHKHLKALVVTKIIDKA